MKLWESGASPGVARIVEQFTAGDDLALDERLFRYDILGSLAHAAMLHKIGVLSQAEHRRIQKALVDLLNEPIQLTVSDEDVHTKLENLLTEHVGEAGKKIHTARSRNDQVLVALRLYTKDQSLEIIETLLGLAEACVQQAQRYEWQPMPGYTHGRPAMLSSVGFWIGSFAESLLEDLEFIEAGYELVDENPLGAAAGYGVPLAIDRELTTRLLGFSQLQKNGLAVMNSRGKIEFAVLATLSCVLIDLNRLASDLILFSGEEFGFFELPAEFCTGSSIMPHKKNPDLLELIRARSARVLAATGQQALLLKGLTSGYHRDLQETKRPLFEALETTHGCLTILALLVARLGVNEKRLNAALTPELFAVDEMLERVSKGVPLRDAYRQVKEQLSKLRRRDAVKALQMRSHIGGPGNLQLANLGQQIAQKQREWSVRQNQFEQAITSLLGKEALTR